MSLRTDDSRGESVDAPYKHAHTTIVGNIVYRYKHNNYIHKTTKEGEGF